jgi:acyl-CoA reductase-like NAD-dependent aldehyde dehydrogenase
MNAVATSITAARPGESEGEPRRHDHAWINGTWVAAGGAGAGTSVHDSFSERVVAHVRHGSAEQAAQAVQAAAYALREWSARPAAERAGFLEKFALALEARAEPLAARVTQEVGMPLKLSAAIQVKAPIEAWRAYAKAAREMKWQSDIGHSRVHQVPIGVVACITPWNYPLHQITAKVAPALAAGCTVVLKPSELAPASAQVLAEASADAGLPPGVFNLVFGDGAVGEALACHPAVQMVSFTGSTAVGAKVAAKAAGQMKRLGMELGGKSAAVVLPGAHLALAVRRTLGACMLNSGQTCNALSRLLVPRSDLAEVLELAAQAAQTFAMGDPLARETRLGPLVSAAHAAHVTSMMTRALAHGATVVAGGPDAARPARGFFVPATVLLVDPRSEIAQEEVFGPVLCVIGYDTVDEAVAIANGTRYGLAAAVWARDDEAALSVALRLRAGQVDINGASFNMAAPFGGFGMSGVGRENGPLGLAAFVEPLSVQMPPDPAAIPNPTSSS